MVQNSKTSNSLAGSCTRHHKTYRLSFTPKRIRSPVRHKSVGWGFTAAPWKVVLAGEQRILHSFTLDGLLEGIQWFSWTILNSWIDIPEVANCRFHITPSIPMRHSARMTWMIWSTGFARLRRKKGCFLSCSPWDDLRKIRKGDHKDQCYPMFMLHQLHHGFLMLSTSFYCGNIRNTPLILFHIVSLAMWGKQIWSKKSSFWLLTNQHRGLCFAGDG